MNAGWVVETGSRFRYLWLARFLFSELFFGGQRFVVAVWVGPETTRSTSLSEDEAVPSLVGRCGWTFGFALFRIFSRSRGPGGCSGEG